MALTKITLDFETAWSIDYTLSKRDISLANYIRDPRFRAHGVGLKIENRPTKWVTHKDLPALFDKLPWERVLMIGHNLKFDASILKWIYGKAPALMLDTKCMARALYGNVLPSFTLDVVAKALLGKQKGNELSLSKGYLGELPPHIEASLAGYCINDCDLTYEICAKLWPFFPKTEVLAVDWTIRMFSEPMLELDGPQLLAYRQEVLDGKAKLLADLDGKYGKDVFTSNPKFAKVLEDLGITPPTKISPSTGKETYAFAKTDEDFIALKEHDNLEVSLVAQARMGIKTSIMETRALSYAKHAGYPWPVDIEYCGALQTHRLAGAAGGGGNPQNMGRDKPAILFPSGAIKFNAQKAGIRRAIHAPKGYKVIVGDSSNIELRVAMKLAMQQEALDVICSGGDLYCWFASLLFNRPITKADITERFLGKEACLSLQYQSGAEKFRKTAGLKGVIITLEQSKDIVNLYRETFYKIPALWKILQKAIGVMARGESLLIPPAEIVSTGVDPFFLAKYNSQVPAIIGPMGMNLRYPMLRRDHNDQWVYTTRTFKSQHETKLYGGKAMENICQFLAGVVIKGQALILKQEMPIVMQVHDELVSVVPEEKAAWARDRMQQVMSTPPPWWPDLPVASEVKYHEIYGEAK